MNNIHVGVEGVHKLLCDLDPHKAPGPDAIPARTLKLAAEELAPVLTLIFQKSLDTGEIPLLWRQANITPIFKKGDRTLPANYRPVSLTSICSKILEHIIHSQIMRHLNNHAVLTENQHGFRRNHSCESQLILTVQDLARSLDKKMQIDMAIMDFSKAFDVVPHKRLISKLRTYGIHNSALTWISNFLCCRLQRVVVSGEKSGWSKVISGVPQGTVLGPLLFFLYINDLPCGVTSSVRLFADDCILYREIKSPHDHVALQKDLDALNDWANRWQMKFNIGKCSIMRISHARTSKVYTYTLGGEVLSVVEQHPYLGITISDRLNWNSHIQSICGKANRALGFVRRNLHACRRSTKLEAYRSLVRPLLEYSSSVWDPHTKLNIDRLEAVQRRGARFIFNDYTSNTPGCVTDMLTTVGLAPLEVRRKIRRLTIFKQSITGHLTLPIGNLLQPVQRQSRHHHSESYSLIFANKDCYKFSFVPRTIRDWNALPYSAVSIPGIDGFKTAVTKHLGVSMKLD